jgi:hypothetical protein
MLRQFVVVKTEACFAWVLQNIIEMLFRQQQHTVPQTTADLAGKTRTLYFVLRRRQFVADPSSMPSSARRIQAFSDIDRPVDSLHDDVTHTVCTQNSQRVLRDCAQLVVTSQTCFKVFH